MAYISPKLGQQLLVNMQSKYTWPSWNAPHSVSWQPEYLHLKSIHYVPHMHEKWHMETYVNIHVHRCSLMKDKCVTNKSLDCCILAYCQSQQYNYLLFWMAMIIKIVQKKKKAKIRNASTSVHRNNSKYFCGCHHLSKLRCFGCAFPLCSLTHIYERKYWLHYLHLHILKAIQFYNEVI